MILPHSSRTIEGNAARVEIRRGGLPGTLGRADETAKSERHAPDQVRDQQRLNAMSVLRRELEREGLKTSELPGLRKGHPIKIRIAEILRRKTTMGLREIAELLHAGHWRSLANALSKICQYE